MSNALAIGAITYILRDLLNSALLDKDITSALGDNASVKSDAPDRLVGSIGSDEGPTLNIFLHRITPNAALSNMDLPNRNSSGQLVNPPRLAVNLHYLITAFGNKDLQREILLGYAMLVLHELSLFPREMIRYSLQNLHQHEHILPGPFKTLKASRLADQIELIKVTPETLSMDDMSKIWTSLQSSYRPSIGYEVSVALMESELPTIRPLPVLMRGEGDAGALVAPNLIPPVPTLLRLSMASGQPAARMGDTVILDGYHLTDIKAVRFTNPATGGAIYLAPQSGGTPSSVKVDLPATLPPDTDWRVGPYLVEAVFTDSDGDPYGTNALPLLLTPYFHTDPTLVATWVGGQLRYDIVVRPPVTEDQIAELYVGVEHLAEIVPASSTTRSNLQFRGGALPPDSTHTLRLRVNGIESLVVDMTTSPPQFDYFQSVKIPQP